MVWYGNLHQMPSTRKVGFLLYYTTGEQRVGTRDGKWVVRSALD